LIEAAESPVSTVLIELTGFRQPVSMMHRGLVMLCPFLRVRIDQGLVTDSV
jgi:hypothetical protein